MTLIVHQLVSLYSTLTSVVTVELPRTSVCYLLNATTALRPQLLSIYRYAEYKKCDRPWDDFKWCFFNNKLDDEQKLKAWIERRADWWARRRLNRSSEDVWDAREDTEQPKTWPTSNLDPNAPLYN